MSDEKWLRDGLADAVPEPPGNPDRAHAAESLARRRRRTTALAVVGSAGSVAAAAVLTVTLSSGGDDGNDAVDTTSEGPASVVECPPIEVGKDGVAGGVHEPDPSAPDAVPEGATSARLCQGVGTAFEFPDDALVTGVDDLVTAVNELEPTGAPKVCTDELGPGYRIAFGYDDGSTFVVSGQLYGCRTLVVGSSYRAGPEAADAAFRELLDAQQGQTGGSSEDADASDLACADAASAQGVDVSDLSAAILCIDEGNGTERAAVIDSADLELLVDDMTTHQTTGVLRCGVPPPHPTIVASDSDGTLSAIRSECGTGWWRLPNGKVWTPSDDAIAILDRVVSEARRAP